MRKIFSAAAMAVAMLSATAANAGAMLFDFDDANSSVNVVSNTPDFCIFGSCKLTADLLDPFANVSIQEGQSETFDFVTFYVSKGFGFDTDARVEAQLAFVTPDSDPVGTGGTGNYLRLGGIFTPGLVAGSLIWDNPVQQITLANGSKFTVAFSNLHGVTFGDNATSTVTVTVDSIVPEPASWALMIGGFGMAGATLRRRRALAA